MNNSVKIAIIGRGIAGLSAAYRLLEAGIRPVLFGDRDGSTVASRCAQGVLCNKGLFLANSPLFRAKIASLSHIKALLPRLERDAGRAIPHVFEGVEEPYWSAADFQATVSRVYRHRFWGCHGTQNRHGRLFYPLDGWFDVPALLDALETTLEREGLRLENARIDRIEAAADKQVCLHASGGMETFDRVIVAAGAGLRDLYPQLQLKPLKSFAIAGQTLRFDLPEKSSSCILVKASLSLAMQKQTALLGSSSLKEGMPLDEDQAQLLAKAKEAFGYDFQGSQAQSRFGVRLRFGDRMPLVGFAPEPWGQSLYFLAGFYKNGVHLADICAQEMLRDFRGEARLYPEFSFARFQ